MTTSFGGLIIDINRKKGGFGDMGKEAYACFLIIMIILAAGTSIFLLRKFEPVRNTSCVTGKIVKFTDNSIEIRPSSGSAAQVFSKLENIEIYRDILTEFQRDNVPIEIYFGATYFPFSKKTVWTIDAVSLNFGPER